MAGLCWGPGWAPGSSCGTAPSAQLRRAPCQAANAMLGKHAASLQEGLNCWAVGPRYEGFARSPLGALVVLAGTGAAAFSACCWCKAAAPQGLQCWCRCGVDSPQVPHWLPPSGPWPGPARLPDTVPPSMPPSPPCHAAGQPGCCTPERHGTTWLLPREPHQIDATPEDLFPAALEAKPGPELAAARHRHRQARGRCQSFNKSQTTAWLEVTD